MDSRSVSLFTSVAMGVMVLCLGSHHFYVKKLLLEKYLDYVHLENQTLIASLASLKEAGQEDLTSY